MKKIFFCVSLVSFLVSCITPKKKDNNLSFSINGTFKECAGDTAYLEILKEIGPELMDSVHVDKDGNFLLEGKILDGEFYVLHFNNREKQITLIPDSCEQIRIQSGDKDYEKNYTVENSPESEKICQIVARLFKMQRVTDTLGKIFRNSISDKNLAEIKDSLDHIYDINYKELRTYSENFLRDNKNSLSQIVCLSQYITPKTPLFDPEKDLDVYKSVYENMAENYPKNFYTKKLGAYIERQKLSFSGEKPLPGRISEGMKAPEIALPGIKGDTVRLSKFKGKYILVDFWASWSDVSQKNNGIVAKIYKKYSDYNFTVFQVSLDKRYDVWKKKLKEEKIPWVCVSDFKVWNTKPVQDYGVRTLPADFLIYPDFTVHEINTPLEKLDSKLEKLVDKTEKNVKTK